MVFRGKRLLFFAKDSFLIEQVIMMRRTWIGLIIIIGLAASLLILHAWFQEAFPIVALRITADRESVLRQAEQMAVRFNWGPSNAWQAATFQNGDALVQYFIELEGGGKREFTRVFHEGLYHPYQWQVRRFRPLETNETIVSFTPAGQPYGFFEKIPENQPGASLTPDAARLIAERMVTNEWRVTLSDFQLVESSKEVMPGGRTDHTFVYERIKERLGEGRYRLSLEISGDRLTQLRHFIKVPDSFMCRYEQMRSANETVSKAANFIIFLGYGLGTLLALVLLLRYRVLIWRMAAVWALVIATLGLLAGLNAIPLMWMFYDTMQPVSVFWIRYGIGLIFSWAAMGVIFTLTIAVAESLTRRYLPHLLQFWRLWSPPVARQPLVLGMTIGGYCSIVVFLALQTLLYLVGQRYLGWWQPMEQVIDPNIIATPFPWLPPLAMALQAGFLEECLFRAIPLAGLIAIGKALGIRRGWLAVAVVVQALIFGAGHANYAQQPAYVRIVEIMPEAIIFGLIYLRFGLLPVIIAHFGFDMALMSLPLFLTRGPYIWVDQLLAAGLALVPLWVVLVMRRRKADTHESAADYTNAAWKPKPVLERTSPVSLSERPPRRALSRIHLITAISAGALGLLVWVLTAYPHSWSGKLLIHRAEAIALARHVLAEDGMNVGPEWKAQARVNGGLEQAERYVWQTQGTNGFRQAQALGYMRLLIWSIRFVRFDQTIDVADRAESFIVCLADTGRVTRITHSIPENRAGQTLTESQAREIANRRLRTQWPERFPALSELSVSPSKRPNRTDWSFTFYQTNCPGFTNQELRIGLSLADGRVAGFGTYCNVPESWVRQESRQRAQYDIAESVCKIVKVMAIIMLMGAVIFAVSRGKFNWRMAVFLAIIITGLGLLDFANSWVTAVADFSPIQPYGHQLLSLCLHGVITITMSAIIIGLFWGYVASELSNDRRSWRDILMALGWGAAMAGLDAGLKFIGPSLQPEWASAEALANYIPWAVPIVSDLTAFLAVTVIVMACVRMAAPLAWGRRRWIIGVIIVLVSIISAGNSIDKWDHWLFSGIGGGLLMVIAYFQLIRRRPALIPVMLAGAAVMDMIQTAMGKAYPEAAVSYAATAVIILGLAVAWWLWLTRNRRSVQDQNCQPVKL